MNRYRTREITVGRYVKQQTRYYPQYQEAGDTGWLNFALSGTGDDVYFNSLVEAEDFLDNQVEEEVIHEYLPSDVHLETRFTTSIARGDDF